MCTFIAHAAVGLGAACLLAPRQPARQYWWICAILPTLPDLDVIGFWAGIPYEHILGHRGISHSLLFGVVLGVLAWLTLKRATGDSPGLGTGLVFTGLAVSHGLLDTFTNGGLGIALLAPFDNGRYFAWTTPIQVSPIGLQGFLSAAGLRTLLSELRWVILPSLAVCIFITLLRKLNFMRVYRQLPGISRTRINYFR